MTTLTADRHLTAAAPAVSVSTLGLMFISGFFATICFLIFGGQVISPGLGFCKSFTSRLGTKPSGKPRPAQQRLCRVLCSLLSGGPCRLSNRLDVRFRTDLATCCRRHALALANCDLRCWSVGLCHWRYHGNRRFAVLPELYRHHLGRPGWPRALCRRDGRCS